MNEAGLILLVEDNVYILDANRQILTHDGHTVLTAGSLAETRKLLKTTSPDVVVLDIMLPDGDGLDFLPELRKSCCAPVLFLTAKDKPCERLAGLLAGGNDYITKPYDIEEFRIRVKNFVDLHRSFQVPLEVIELGSLKLDLLAHQAFLDDEDLVLSPKEFSLLHLFVANEGEVLSVRYLYEKAWGQPMMQDDTGPVKTVVSRLRARLDESEFFIETHRGVGYCLVKE